MITLNLTANGKPQELILAYLQQNASQTLAEKINNGTPFTKDGKTLTNKKTLDGFMKYATDEARKLAEKGANSACVEDDVVFGWAVHYFEEESIVGTLYNEDGTEYKPATKTATKTTTKATTPTTYIPPKPQPKPQMSIFEMMTGENDGNSSIVQPQPQNTVKTQEIEQKAITPVICADKPKRQPSPYYLTYLKLIERHEGFLILLRMGDFYEALKDHATTLASELNLTLTGRDCGLEERVPMVGIPYHAIDNYVNKLIDRGYKVILAEDLNNVIEFKDVDEYDEPEELTEEEMRQFDGYIDEDEELPTVSKIVTEYDQDEDDTADILDRESTNAFDKEALCIISDLLDGEITLA